MFSFTIGCFAGAALLCVGMLGYCAIEEWLPWNLLTRLRWLESEQTYLREAVQSGKKSKGA
jgi:hypothetical protein